jgi:hypothetical protein
MTCLAQAYLSYSSRKRHDFRKTCIGHEMRILIVLNNFHLKLPATHCGKNSARCTYLDHHVKCLVFFSDFNKTGIFWMGFNKNLQYEILSRTFLQEPATIIRLSSIILRLLNIDFILTVYNAVFYNLNFIHMHRLYCVHSNCQDL